MNLAQKALYNSLRMGYVQDTSVQVEPWKVEDLRLLSLDELFFRLKKREIFLDRGAFVSGADDFDSPEDFAAYFNENTQLNDEEREQVYLLVFELWRRLIPEKPSISIICDELDHQIFAYDQGALTTIDALQDALAHFHTILEENADRGISKEEVFSALTEYCANNIEDFLYDYINELLDTKQEDIAGELVEQFAPFVIDKKWFEFLKARLVSKNDFHQANLYLRDIFEQNLKEPELKLNFDMLAFMVHGGDSDLFLQIARHTLSLIDQKEDLIELMSNCQDFFSCLDLDEEEAKIEALIQDISSRSLQIPLQEDKAVRAFSAIIEPPQAT